MKKTINYHENSVVLVHENATEFIENLVKDGTTRVDAVATFNDLNKKKAFDKIVGVDKSINWLQMVFGVYFPVANENDDEIKTRKLSANDCFILKSNKKSYKVLIPKKILHRIEMFGVNVAKNKYENIGLDDNEIKALKVNANINGLEKCFTCENAHSMNNLEEQFKIILDLLLGENAKDFTVRKKYVRHLVEQFTVAYGDGYKNGNEIKLLQLVFNHAFDCFIKKDYENKSGLQLHREIKEKATK